MMLHSKSLMLEECQKESTVKQLEWAKRVRNLYVKDLENVIISVESMFQTVNLFHSHIQNGWRLKHDTFLFRLH